MVHIVLVRSGRKSCSCCYPLYQLEGLEGPHLPARAKSTNFKVQLLARLL